MLKVIVQKGFNKQIDIEISKDKFFIGRDSSCDLTIDESNVSRKHAVIKRQDEKCTIEDLGSSNGTFLNSTPIKGQTIVKHMDVVQIGKTIFVFHDTESKDNLSHTSGDPLATQTLDPLQRLIVSIEANVGKVFFGKDDILRNVLICMFSDGHVLIEDVPGVGKTILAQSLAKSIQGEYRRIQFTPDMLPADLTGLSIYNAKEKEFDFMPGPIFGNIILADEINRTTPRTQSSLLECMTDASVTIDGKSYVLPKPFFVIATQNPSDFHGTYPLPEAQLDRFMMRLSIGYPEKEVEREILTTQVNEHPLTKISYVANALDIPQTQAIVRGTHVSESIKDYIIKITHATRTHSALSLGCSPRSSLALMKASQALAAFNGRKFVLPGDVQELVLPVLAHRVLLKLRLHDEWEEKAEILTEIVKKTPIEDD